MFFKLYTKPFQTMMFALFHNRIFWLHYISNLFISNSAFLETLATLLRLSISIAIVLFSILSLKIYDKWLHCTFSTSSPYFLEILFPENWIMTTYNLQTFIQILILVWYRRWQKIRKKCLVFLLRLIYYFPLYTNFRKFCSYEVYLALSKFFDGLQVLYILFNSFN